MPVKKYDPITSSRRFATVLTFEELSKSKPERTLLKKLDKTGGRNSYGRITAKYRGGGHKRKYRIIDFKRDKDNIPSKVASIEYDPNRASRIALLKYADGEKRYIVSPLGLKVGDVVMSGAQAEISVGNALYLKNIPLGITVHNVEFVKGKGGQLVRGAGCGAVIMAKEGKFAHLKLPSGEIRLIPVECKATIGQVGNVESNIVSLGKAGRKRWLGRKPRVRAVAMNPVDHPMGGGEGKSSGGRHPCSPRGVPAKGYKTRRKSKSSKHIVKSRKKN